MGDMMRGVALEAEIARLTRELDEARRAAHDTAPLRARAEQAEAERDRLREQLRLANIDATTNEAEANDLRAERDRLREVAEALIHSAPADEPEDPESSNADDNYEYGSRKAEWWWARRFRAALRGEEGSP